MNRLPLSALTLDAVQAEAIRAHLKHGSKSLLNPDMPVAEKLAALGEEFGEVCRALTYDEKSDPDHLVAELIQVASVALSWVESIEGQTFTVEPPRVETFLLWSNKHQMWWRPARMGYTTNRDEAGRYTREQAVNIVLRSSFYGVVSQVTCMVAVAE